MRRVLIYLAVVGVVGVVVTGVAISAGTPPSLQASERLLSTCSRSGSTAL
jgi:hypothetical protein